MRPVVGITAYRQRAQWGVWDREADVLACDYADAVADAGGAPVLLPALPGVVETAAASLSGVILSGGTDLGPATYHAEADPRSGPFRADRDAAELALVRYLVAHRRPLLGICRGAQVLNVGCGGDLLQHVEGHRGGDGVFSPTSVTIEAGSWLAGVLGARQLVQCHHHQTLGRLGRRLRVVAWAADGVAEAVELDGPGFAVGVQWHPEESPEKGLFTGFLERVAASR